MGTLTGCITKFNKLLPEDDLQQMKSMRNDFVADGLSPDDAALAAVDELAKEAGAFRQKIVDQVEAAGGVDPATATRQPAPETISAEPAKAAPIAETKPPAPETKAPVSETKAVAKGADQGKAAVRGKTEGPGSTEQEFDAAIQKEFGPGAMQILSASFVNKPEDLGGKHSADTLAITKPDGSVTFVLDNIPSKGAVGVFAHESVHAVVWPELKANGVLEATVSDLKRLRKSNKAVQEAYDQVPADTKAADVDEEALAYLVQNKPKMSVVQRFVTAVKRALKAMGFNNKWVNDNTDEIRQTVIDTIRRRASGEPSLQRPAAKRANEVAARGTIKTSPKAKKLKRWWREQMTIAGGLPQKVFGRKIQRDNDIGADRLHIEHLMIDFDRTVKKAYKGGPNEFQTQQINSHLAGQNVDIPQSVKDVVAPMRQYLDLLSKKMVSEGVVDTDSKVAETISGNLGRYLTRSYRAFDLKDWPDRVSEAVKGRARKYLKGELSPEQRAQPDVDALVEGKLNNILQEGTAADHMGALISQSKLGAKDLSMLIKRKQIAPEIRDLLGEYRDPRVNFVRSATKMTFAINNHQFLAKVKADGLGTLFFPEPRGEFSVRIAAAGSEAMSPLNDLYTTPDIKSAFELALEKEHLSDMHRALLGANGLVKYGKVVLAPTTQARNFMSAFFFAAASGHVPTPKRAGIAAKTIGGELLNKTSQRKYMIKLKRLGVVHDNPRAGELINALKDFSENGGRMEGILGGKARKGFNFLTKLYQAEDDFWKVLGFEAETALLMKHKKLNRAEAEPLAAQRIRDTYPTYSLVVRKVKWLRRFPLMGTFVSFPAEILRTSGNIIKYLKQDLADPDLRPLARRRAAGVIIAGGWTYVLSQFSMALMGLDDEDDEAVKELAPPWQRNSQLKYSGYDQDGNLQYVDLSYADPYAYLKRPISALLKGEPVDELLLDAMKEMAEPFFGPDIAASALGEVVFNNKLDGGEVYNPAASTFDQTKQIADHLRKSLQPGVAGNAERIMKALQGRTSRSGKKFDLLDELWALIGIRTSTADVKTPLVYRTFEFNDRVRDATRILSQPLGDQNKVSDEDITDAFNRMNHARREAWDDMAKLVRAARFMGVEEDQMARIMSSANMSKGNAAALVNDRFVPWMPSKQFLLSAARRAKETSTPARWLELQGEFKRRRELINKLTKEHLEALRDKGSK